MGITKTRGVVCYNSVRATFSENNKPQPPKKVACNPLIQDQVYYRQKQLEGLINEKHTFARLYKIRTTTVQEAAIVVCRHYKQKYKLNNIISSCMYVSLFF